MPLSVDPYPAKFLVFEDSKSSTLQYIANDSPKVPPPSYSEVDENKIDPIGEKHFSDIEVELTAGKVYKMVIDNDFFSPYSNAIALFYWSLSIPLKLQSLVILSHVKDDKNLSENRKLHTNYYSNPPPSVLSESNNYSITNEDVLLSFLWFDLQKEFISSLNRTGLRNIRYIVNRMVNEKEKFQSIKNEIYRILLALDKSSFWRFPSQAHRMKRSELSSQRKKFENCFFSNVKNAKISFPQPYILTSISIAYLNNPHFPLLNQIQFPIQILQSLLFPILFLINKIQFFTKQQPINILIYLNQFQNYRLITMTMAKKLIIRKIFQK